MPKHNSFCNINPRGSLIWIIPITKAPVKQVWLNIGYSQVGWFELHNDQHEQPLWLQQTLQGQETVEVLPSKVTSAGDKPVVSPGPGI